MTGTSSNIVFGQSGGIPADIYDPATKTMYFDRVVAPSGVLSLDPLDDENDSIIFDGIDFIPFKPTQIRLGTLTNKFLALNLQSLSSSSNAIKFTKPLLHGSDLNTYGTIVREVVILSDEGNYFLPGARTLVGWFHIEGHTGHFAMFFQNLNNVSSLLFSSGDVATTDTDGNTCLIEQSGSPVIKNRNGQTYTYFIEYKYID